MNKTLKHGLKGIGIYSLIFYIILAPFHLWLIGIPIAIIFSMFFSILDSINTQLRKLNGEKFENIE